MKCWLSLSIGCIYCPNGIWDVQSQKYVLKQPKRLFGVNLFAFKPIQIQMLLPQFYTQLQHFKSKQQYLSVLSLQHIPSFVFNLFPASFPSQNVKACVKLRIDLSWNMSHGMTPSPETKQIHQKRNPQLTLVQVTLSWLLLPFTSTIFLPTIPLLHLCNITSGCQRKLMQ